MHRNNVIKIITSEDEMLLFGAHLAKCITSGANIFLNGSLGVGKTTFTRGFLQGMGYVGKVKSPTYTIVESYRIKNIAVNHFDLYRLHDTRELEYIGIHEYFTNSAITFVEWPDHGLAVLPDPDLNLRFHFDSKGRKVQMDALSERGLEVLRRFRALK